MKFSTLRATELTILLLSATCIGCITETATPDPVQIEAGLKIAAKASPTMPSTLYTVPRSEPQRLPEVAIVVAREAAEAPPQLIPPSNSFVGTAIRVEMNPTQLVVGSIFAFMDDYADVSIVPTVDDVASGTLLILEPVITSVRWRMNGWRYAYFAVRVEAAVDLTLRDHTNGTEEILQSGWVTGGTYGGGATQAGHTNRVIRAIAHATAVVLNRGSVLSRLPQD